MANLFLSGSLQHRGLLQIVLDHDPGSMVPAILPGHAIAYDPKTRMSVLVARPDREAPGMVLRGADGSDLERLAYFIGPGAGRLETQAQVAGQSEAALVHLVNPEPTGLAEWNPAEWERTEAALVCQAACEYMDEFGKIPAADASARFSQMLMRASSILRARQTSAPASLRADFGPDSVQVLDRRRPYSAFFTVEEHDLSFPRYDQQQSPVVTRAAMVAGDAVTVLPYDPVRDRVMVIEQFRFGPFVRGDLRPWVLEPPAGRIDPGESPEQAVRRELREEAGLDALQLFHVASYYPSPGAWTEYLMSYVAIADLPDSAAGIGGVEDEAEDIKSHVLDFADALDLVATGEAQTGPLIMTLLWLQGHRDKLRGET